MHIKFINFVIGFKITTHTYQIYILIYNTYITYIYFIVDFKIKIQIHTLKQMMYS